MISACHHPSRNKMATFTCPIPPSFFFLLLLLPFTTGAAGGPCPATKCPHGGPPVRFPFRLKTHHPEPCGYPGFGLSCDPSNGTTIDLPFWGVFRVQAIDYVAQELWINDPENCLPRRILSLNLSGTPFRGIHHQSFTFFSCPTPDFLRYRPLNPIACLSGGNGTVYATASPRAAAELGATCRKVKTVKAVPVDWPFHEAALSSDLSEDLWLKWHMPMCRRCELRGGRCTRKPNSAREIACHGTRKSGISRMVRYAIAIGAGIPGSLCLLGLIGLVYSRISACVRTPRHGHHPVQESNQAAISGLEQPTIDSYPKIVLGESKRLPKQNDSTCSICLSEYKPRETLKTIPHCGHCFHSDCIDEWLRLNPTCPICRKSPEKLLPGDASSS